MYFKQHRYSNLIVPASYVIDLAIINVLAYFLPINLLEPLLFHSYISISWLIMSSKNEFYRVHRFSKITHIFKLLFSQFFFYFLILYAFIGFFKQPVMSRLALGQYFVYSFLLVSVFKLLNYLLLMKYRERVKGNLRNVVIIGKNKKTDQLRQVFNERTEFGYSFHKQFSPKSKDFELQNCFDYILDNKIDEIYCSVSELKNEEIAKFISFADNNLKTLKFIPDNKNIFSKKTQI